MTVAKDQVVHIDYTLTNDSGEVLDTSQGRTPLAYIHGHGHIIVGLENEMEGKTKGDKFKVSVNPEKGYGTRDENLVQSVAKTEFQDADQLQPGMQFQVDTPNGPMVLTVLEIKDTDIVLDGNHPLAGQTLHFEVEVVEIRPATQDELSHGHVHGPGGHDH